MHESPAICWSYGRTLGNIAVYSQSILGNFPGNAGTDAVLPCDIVSAGKFRHGVNRWWCRTHQVYWGTKADIESYSRIGKMICANHDQKMNYVVDPFELDPSDHYQVGIWCSMPAALSSRKMEKRTPKIHVHVREKAGEHKTVDGDYDAISVRNNQNLELFGKSKISLINITPPAAFEFVQALELGRETDCVNCSTCGYPHLDLGDFGITPHKKHFCANCGYDSTWSKEKIISTPLKPLHDSFLKNAQFVEPNRSVNLDECQGCTYNIWASTPAIVWKADRPQEKGIHVHVHDGKSRIIDDTYSEVILGGQKLVRAELFQKMVEQTII